MRTCVIAGFILAAICFGAGPACAADSINLCLEQEAIASNLVENGSFEEQADGFAKGWSRTADACRIAGGRDVHESKYLLMTIPSGQVNANVSASKPMSVAGVTNLRLSFTARVTTTRAEGTRVIVEFKNKAGKTINNTVQHLETNAAWAPYFKVIQVPPDACAAMLELALIRVTGELAIDDLQLTPIRYPRAWSELDNTQDPALGAIDGVEEITRPHLWASGKMQNTFSVELLGERLIQRVVWRYWSKAPAGIRTQYGLEDYSIWLSPDGEVWFRLVDQKGFLGGWNEHAFPPVRARFVRIRIDKAQMYCPMLTEFEVWGTTPPATAAVPPANSAEPKVQAKQPQVMARVNRLRSAPGTPLTATMTMTNLSAANCPATLTLWLQHGVEPVQRLKDWHLAAALGDTARIDFALDPKLEVGGYHLLFKWRFRDRVLTSADDVFEINADPRAGCRTSSFYAPYGLQPGFAEEFIRGHIQKCRESYADTLKLSQRWVEMGVACPKTSPYVTSPFHFLNSQRTARLWCELLHEDGLTCIAYHLFGYAAPVDKPEWFVYGPLDYPPESRDRLAHGGMLIGKKLEQYYPAGKPAGVHQAIWPNDGVFQNTLAMKDYYADQFSRDMLQAGWDGYFLDEIYCAFEPTAYGYDQQGRRITDMDHDTLGDTVLTTIREGVKTNLGRFPVLVGNFGNLNGMAPGYRESVDVILANRGKTSYPRTARHLIWFLELLGAPEAVTSMQSYLPQTYEQLCRGIRGIRELNDTPVIVELCEYTRKATMQTVNNVAPAYAIVCAAGATHEILYNDSKVREQVIKPFNKFCVRYADYLFPFTIHWARDIKVTAEPAGSLYWEDTIFRKQISDTESELYIHLINLPREHGLYEIQHEVPAVATNVALTLTLPEKTVATAAWCLSPAGDQDPIALPVNDKRLTVPEIKTWALVLVRLKAKS